MTDYIKGFFQLVLMFILLNLPIYIIIIKLPLYLAGSLEAYITWKTIDNIFLFALIASFIVSYYWGVIKYKRHLMYYVYQNVTQKFIFRSYYIVIGLIFFGNYIFKPVLSGNILASISTTASLFSHSLGFVLVFSQLVAIILIYSKTQHEINRYGNPYYNKTDEEVIEELKKQVHPSVLKAYDKKE